MQNLGRMFELQTKISKKKIIVSKILENYDFLCFHEKQKQNHFFTTVVFLEIYTPHNAPEDINGKVYTAGWGIPGNFNLNLF